MANYNGGVLQLKQLKGNKLIVDLKTKSIGSFLPHFNLQILNATGAAPLCSGTVSRSAQGVQILNFTNCTYYKSHRIHLTH